MMYNLVELVVAVEVAEALGLALDVEMTVAVGKAVMVLAEVK